MNTCHLRYDAGDMNASTHPAQQTLDTPPSTSRGVSPWWRILAITAGLALLIGGAASVSMYEQFRLQFQHVQKQLAEQPQVRYVAVLQDNQQRPGLLATLDLNTAEMHLQRLNDVQEGREDTMQLWALRDGQPPQSLGVLTPKLKTLQLPIDAKALEGATQLAISVEDKGGVAPEKGPRLPYLFTGWWVQKAL